MMMTQEVMDEAACICNQGAAAYWRRVNESNVGTLIEVIPHDVRKDTGWALKGPMGWYVMTGMDPATIVHTPAINRHRASVSVVDSSSIDVVGRTACQTVYGLMTEHVLSHCRDHRYVEGITTRLPEFMYGFAPYLMG